MIKETIIKEIDITLAKPFIETWHYSHVTPTGKNIFFGWFACDSLLYAVADYGIGVNPYQAGSLSKLSSTNVDSQSLLELKRLCRVEPKIDELQLTYFLAKCHKILKTRGYKHIVSFSDPYYGHNGGIYKAANFIHLGQTNKEWHVIDTNGVVRHRRYYYRYARRHSLTMEEARQKLMLTRFCTPPKDRWFYEIK